MAAVANGRIERDEHGVRVYAPPAMPPTYKRKPVRAEDTPIVDALHAAEYDAQNQAIASRTIATIAIALAWTILNKGDVVGDPRSQAIRIPKEAVERVRGMKLAFRETADDDIDLRILERGGPDLIVVRGND